jgi:hypothetical protein
MNSILKRIQQYADIPISRSMMLNILHDYKRPNDKISDLMKGNYLIQLKRGLYVAGPASSTISPEPFLIANHLRGPSYISRESALSYYNMIPEKVMEYSSVTTNTSKIYYTPLGRFSYTKLKIPYYTLGIDSVEIANNQVALIAKPEKAICDLIILTSNVKLRSIKQTKEYLFEDLRIDYDALIKLDISLIKSWVDNAPKKGSIEMLIQTLGKL